MDICAVTMTVGGVFSILLSVDAAYHLTLFALFGAVLQQVLTTIDVARWLGVSADVLRAWRLNGRGPKFHRFGHSVRYLPQDVADFIERCAVQPTAPMPPTQATEKGAKRQAR